MSRYYRGIFVTPIMIVMMMMMVVVMVMVMMTMMPPLALGTIADGLAVSVETSFLIAARMLERRLDVLVDGPLAVRSRRSEAHFAKDGTSG